jgi:antitoxin component YwqK of YwqJK toxin-antitoxin module
MWYENGQQAYEGNYKDGKQDGLWPHWYENGQKSSKNTYKDGELISSKCWDKDGNEYDCGDDEDDWDDEDW